MRVLEWLRKHLPITLRGRMMLLSLVVVSVPIASAGYLLEREGRQALLREKQEKLFGLARVLDAHLGEGYDALLPGRDDLPLGREAAITHLNARLAPFTDMVAAANPGVGVGYYSRALNAIVTYGPSRQYGNTVGLPIPPGHPGWKVLGTGRMAVETGPQVRGPIMNAMWPIVRNGAVIGYIWANELADEVERQATVMSRAVFGVSAAGILLGLVLIQAMSRRLARDIRCITTGLDGMRTDLRRMIRPPPGEIGAIADKVNAMARALLEARSLTENILHSIADGVVAVDRGARVTAINPAAQAMMGVAAADVIGRPYQSLFDREVHFTSALLDTLETGREHIGVSLDYPLPSHTLHVNVSSSLLRDSQGTIIGAVVVLKDMTEQRRLQTQVMRADRLAALGELTAGVAHEIRNPLTSIRGFMQFLESCDDIAEWRQYAPVIVRQVDSLNRIVTELLEFGRPRPPAIRPVQINELIGEVARLAGRKSCAPVVLDLAPGLPPIEADGEALKQVVLNLLINAIQAVSEKAASDKTAPDKTAGETATIRIATSMAGPGEIAVTVSDDGAGIAPENLGKIFDPFFSTKADGTGLGLAMAHRIVDAHHGTIAVASTLGAGTEIALRLPIHHTVPRETLIPS